MCTVVALSEKKQVPWSMAIGNEEHMHEFFPNTLAWEQQE